MATTQPKKALHIIDLGGGKKISLELPDVYDNIKSIIGVTKATDADADTADFEDEVSAIKTGKVMKFRLRAVVGGKSRVHNLVAAAASVQSGGLKKLTGKTLGIFGTITGNGYIPSRRKFRG